MNEVKRPDRLEFLIELRREQEPIYSQEKMARFFKLYGKHAHQTVGKWERGQVIPSEKKHRERFLDYLGGELLLRRDSTQFAEKWQILVEEWNWAPLDKEETDKLLPVPNQAPIDTAHFVGRQREVAEIAALLNSQKNIIALVGMGGIGKTALAIHVAHSLKDQFPDGILWARVATDNPLDILQSWAQAYGYDFSNISSVESRAAAVRDMLSDKRVLMVLDDVVNSADGRLLLPNASDCAVLITTRSADVAAALNASHTVSIDGLSMQHGIDLLKKILDEDRVLRENESAHAICEILHNLPLAIEIAAQRLLSRTRLSLAGMVEQLEAHRLDLNINDRAVRSSFAVSWDDLDSPSRHIFSLLGVFEGRSFSTAALAHIADLSETVTESYLADLAALSLVNEDEKGCRQHPLLADFSAEKLEEKQTEQKANPYFRMAEFFFELAQTNRTNYEILDAELDDVMFGMGTAYRFKQWKLLQDYAEILMKPWFKRARYTEARQGYTWAYAGADSTSDHPNMAQNLLRLGQACLEQNDYDEAEETLTKSLNLFMNLENEDKIAECNLNLGRMASECAQYDVAQRDLSLSQEIYVELGDPWGLACSGYQLGLLAYRQNNLTDAQSWGIRSLAIQSELEDHTNMIPSLRLLVHIAIAQEEFDEALSHCQQAIELSERIQDLGELAASYYAQAIIYRSRAQHSPVQAEDSSMVQHDFAQAEDSLKLAIPIFQKTGTQDFLAASFYERSRIKKLQGDLQQAVEDVEDSIEIYRRIENRSSLVYALNHAGKLYKQLGDHEAAFLVWSEAIQICESIDHHLYDEIRLQLEALDHYDDASAGTL